MPCYSRWLLQRHSVRPKEAVQYIKAVCVSKHCMAIVECDVASRNGAASEMQAHR